MADPAVPLQSAERIDRIRGEVMVFSDSFQREYVAWYTGSHDARDGELDCPRLVDLATAELDELIHANQRGAITRLALAASKRLIRNLMIDLLRHDSMSEHARAAIRRVLSTRLTFDYLDPSGSKFTQDYFHYHVERWTEAFGHLSGRSGLLFLEIGSFEGRSTCWMLQHLLTHADSRIICVDPFDSFEEQERNFDFNIRATGAHDKVTKILSKSQVALPLLQTESFDFIYIDGSHLMLDVMLDAVMAWRLVKPGGIVVFDDYEHGWLPDLTRPPVAPAVDAFLTLIAGDYEILFWDWQVAIRKIEGGRRLFRPLVLRPLASPHEVRTG